MTIEITGEMQRAFLDAKAAAEREGYGGTAYVQGLAAVLAIVKRDLPHNGHYGVSVDRSSKDQYTTGYDSSGVRESLDQAGSQAGARIAGAGSVKGMGAQGLDERGASGGNHGGLRERDGDSGPAEELHLGRPLYGMHAARAGEQASEALSTQQHKGHYGATCPDCGGACLHPDLHGYPATLFERHTFVHRVGLINCGRSDDDGHWCNLPEEDSLHHSADYGVGPRNSDFDWTSEQEERAAGLPSAQADDYSEEPLDDGGAA